jgi:hypothetical protein
MGDLAIPARMAAYMLDPAYRRNDARLHWPAQPLTGVPPEFSMYIPGTGRENLSEDIKISGCENYGWGCLGPMLIFENIIGLRPLDALGRSFSVTPVLPEVLKGKQFILRNVSHGPFRFDLTLEREAGGTRVNIRFIAKPACTVQINTGAGWKETEAVDVLLPPQSGLTIKG